VKEEKFCFRLRNDKKICNKVRRWQLTGLGGEKPKMKLLGQLGIRIEMILNLTLAREVSTLTLCFWSLSSPVVLRN
jgi:hypothetical protein